LSLKPYPGCYGCVIPMNRSIFFPTNCPDPVNYLINFSGISSRFLPRPQENSGRTRNRPREAGGPYFRVNFPDPFIFPRGEINSEISDFSLLTTSRRARNLIGIKELGNPDYITCPH
jgi:hypothetical protein